MVGLTIALLLLVPAAALSSSPAPAALQTLETPPVLNVPVYALSTLDAATGDATMNILTYAAPVGIRPARRWCISLYRPTRSHTNFAARRTGVLQLLREVSPLSLVVVESAIRAGGCSEATIASM